MSLERGNPVSVFLDEVDPGWLERPSFDFAKTAEDRTRRQKEGDLLEETGTILGFESVADAISGTKINPSGDVTVSIAPLNDSRSRLGEPIDVYMVWSGPNGISGIRATLGAAVNVSGPVLQINGMTSPTPAADKNTFYEAMVQVLKSPDTLSLGDVAQLNKGNREEVRRR